MNGPLSSEEGEVAGCTRRDTQRALPTRLPPPATTKIHSFIVSFGCPTDMAYLVSFDYLYFFSFPTDIFIEFQLI